MNSDDPTSLAQYFAPLIASPVKRGPKPRNGAAMSSTERSRNWRAPKKAMRQRCIAVLDMETDPFSDDRTAIHPFAAELYSDQFGAIVFWDNDPVSLARQLVDAIEALPDEYTIYAHNGGKFDFFFLINWIKGLVKFKGRAIMSARIGNHELRDSLHILPEKLAAWKKDKFDYRKMRRNVRAKHKTEILEYLHNDCVYLFDIVKRFVSEFGLKLSIGQAAFSELKKSYKVSRVSETMDSALRPYFFGGRVECSAGKGIFDAGWRNQPFKLYDVNSMYPYVMATRQHPIGNEYVWRRGDPGPDTIFIDLTCRNFGAFVARGEQNDASAELEYGRFHTTIWEYETALKYDLIQDQEIHWVIDCRERSDFSAFILPMYHRRQDTKEAMQALKKQGKEFTTEYEEIKKENILLKYLLNNAYGKFAQNPRKYKDFFYAASGIRPEPEWFEFMPSGDRLTDEEREIIHKYSMPIERCAAFDVWARPAPGRKYNNVGTAASITGAARAVWLDAVQHAIDPIYGDTDSLICRGLDMPLDPVKLGYWDLEETFDEVIITGKKQYCCRVNGRHDGQEERLKVRCKGADLRVRPDDPDAGPELWQRANAETWGKYLAILDGQIIEAINRAPTMDKIGRQNYIRRRIRSTAPAYRTRSIHAKVKHGAIGI